MKLFFCVWLGIHGSYKFMQSFEVAVASHAQSDSKQVSYISKRKLGDKLIFLNEVRHIKIHLFDSVHSYGCGQAYLGMPKVISIKSAICQD